LVHTGLSFAASGHEPQPYTRGIGVIVLMVECHERSVIKRAQRTESVEAQDAFWWDMAATSEIVRNEMTMRVEFYRAGDGRVCGWIATPPHRRPFQGSTMAAGRYLPHDLTQFTIERELGIRAGFWGLLAHGGWFASVPGRKATAEGRAIVRAHHAELVAVEGIVNGHYSAWKRGDATPLKPHLDAMYARWLGVADGERLALEWPVSPLPGVRAPRKSSALT
jgi:hypothetical protein